MNTHLTRVQRLLALLLSLLFAPGASARDLPEITRSGVLRHLGTPYANFVTGSGDGLDVEILQGFAAHLGIRYRFVPSSWEVAFGELTGRHVRNGENGVEWLDETEIKGDIIGNGLTILPWRKEVVDFSDPTFPSAVWLLARAQTSVSPIKPSGSLAKDIALVKESMSGLSVLAQESTCLDPALYRLSETRARVKLPASPLKPDEMVPAILDDFADTTLLDVPDALIALERWPGQVKVIGPVSENQEMAMAFRKDSPKLRAAFNDYLAEIRRNGLYDRLVRRYYPSAFLYFPGFFEGR